jgi:hypothetical protein
MLQSSFRNKIRKAFTVLASILIATGAASSIDSAKAQVTTTSVTAAKPRPVPETNTGVVLLPFFAVFLLWSSLTVLRRRAAERQ